MTPHLPADITRCRPGCAVPSMRDTCGRWLAPLPVGARIEDFAMSMHVALTGACNAYTPASECTVPAQVTRRVHGPMGGAA